MGEVKKLIYEFDYLYEDKVCSNVKVFSQGNEEVVEVTDFVDDIVYRAFGDWSSKVTIEDVNSLFESRCVPKSRYKVRELIKAVDSPVGYNVRFFISVTHGTMADDHFWIRFSDEQDLTWEEVKVWKHVNIDK